MPHPQNINQRERTHMRNELKDHRHESLSLRAIAISFFLLLFGICGAIAQDITGITAGTTKLSYVTHDGNPVYKDLRAEQDASTDYPYVIVDKDDATKVLGVYFRVSDLANHLQNGTVTSLGDKSNTPSTTSYPGSNYTATWDGWTFELTDGWVGYNASTPDNSSLRLFRQSYLNISCGGEANAANRAWKRRINTMYVSQYTTNNGT